MSNIQDISNELNTKLNELRLSKNHPLMREKIFVLLEGNTDVKFFRNIFNITTTNINRINGKEKIIKALEILQNEEFTKIIGIKDADFDHLENITYNNINIFLTDYADIEIHMIESSAFQSLINEFSSENCYEEFLSVLKEKIYDKALLIGYLRWFNERYFKDKNRYILRFEGLNYNSFIEVSDCDFSINEENLLLEIISHSKCQLRREELEEEVNYLKSISDNHLQICNGHDIAKILAYLFNHKNNSEKTNIKQDRIEEALRLSYDISDFQQTNLYNDLSAWEKQYNIKILKEE